MRTENIIITTEPWTGNSLSYMTDILLSILIVNTFYPQTRLYYHSYAHTKAYNAKTDLTAKLPLLIDKYYQRHNQSPLKIFWVDNEKKRRGVSKGDDRAVFVHE